MKTILFLLIVWANDGQKLESDEMYGVYMNGKVYEANTIQEVAEDYFLDKRFKKCVKKDFSDIHCVQCWEKIYKTK